MRGRDSLRPHLFPLELGLQYCTQYTCSKSELGCVLPRLSTRQARRRRPGVTNWDTPSARERQLARELRRLRAAIGLNGREAADRLGWTAPKVFRIETRRPGGRPHDLQPLPALYGAHDDPAAYLRNLAPSARSKGWGDPPPA